MSAVFQLQFPVKAAVVHLSRFLESHIRFNISTPAFRGCVKNLKKTTGVVRLNDTVGVTKKCSEDWKVSEEFQTSQRNAPQLTRAWHSLTHQLLTFSGSTQCYCELVHLLHSSRTCKTSSGLHIKFVGK